MPQILRTNPGLLVWILIFTIAAVVCLIVGGSMKRSGTSLRPVLWFAGFLLLIGVPQFVAHFVRAVRAVRREAPRVAALGTLASDAPRESRQPAAKLLFGPDADADLVADARPLFGDALAKAGFARFASLPTGESVLIAHFPGYSDAQRAWFLVLQHTGLNQLGGTGDSERGYAVTRPVGDRAYAVHLDNMVGVWTGPDDGAIRRRMAAGGFRTHRRAPLAAATAAPASDPAAPAPAADPPGFFATTAGKGLLAGGFAIYLVVVLLYFFKGASWSGGTDPQAGVAPIPASELTARLEAINALDVPFRIERGSQPGELFCTWRYADARWAGMASAHSMRRMHRIQLLLDEAARTVRVADYVASRDASVSAKGASVAWKAAKGIVLYQVDHQRVFGLQFDAEGRPKAELSYAYTFKSLEMKAPLIQAVTSAGWAWRPSVWPDSPRWLHWLTH